MVPSDSPGAAPITPQEMVAEGRAWGLCTAVDLHDCHPDLIRNTDHIRRYVDELCELIDMKRFGECQVIIDEAVKNVTAAPLPLSKGAHESNVSITGRKAGC